MTNPQWVAHAYPLKSITIKLQGTKLSTIDGMVSQLVEVADRLNALPGMASSQLLTRINSMTLITLHYRYQSTLNSLSISILIVLLRFSMRFGFRIVVTGETGTGKTSLLERLTPGKLVSGCTKYVESGKEPILTVNDIPEGIFSIDEIMVYEHASLLDLASNYLSNRGYALSLQSLVDFKTLSLDKTPSNHKYIYVALLREKRTV